MIEKYKILVVEDSLPEGAMLVDILEDEGYEVLHVIDAESGLKACSNQTFDLILLDIMLPGKDGYQMLKQVKVINPDVSVIFLTSKNLKSDEIQGFSLGADDYLTKPYDRELLIWRVKAVLKRRSNSEVSISEAYKLGTLTFEYKNLTITSEKEIRRITKREAEILQMLCIKQNELVTRDDLLIYVWGDNSYFNGRSLDVFITKLRKYLKDDENVTIENIHGVGFELRVKN